MTIFFSHKKSKFQPHHDFEFAMGAKALKNWEGARLVRSSRISEKTLLKNTYFWHESLPPLVKIDSSR